MSDKNFPTTTHMADLQTEEYERQQALLAAQPNIIQRFLEAQGRQLSEALLENNPQVRFSLPDRVVCTLENVDQPTLVTIPNDQRTHTVGNFINRLRKEQLYKLLRHVLNELEQSPDRSVSVAASLLRHSTVLHMVYNTLPSGREVTYRPADDEETLASIPDNDQMDTQSALTAASDAIVEENGTGAEDAKVLVPYVPYARLFYLPQWVAFGERGELLVKSLEEADAHIRSMQRFMEVLFKAVALAPYISADPEYSKKRYGMLGQLVNQGRALAIYQTQDIIAHIKARAEAGSLNRGLRLSMPYFDDQDLKISYSNFEIIPAGRIMFVPAFVVRAVYQEQVKVSQDTRYNPSTRKHLMYLLDLLEIAFESES
ncbi:MAG: hypothetical protein A2X25_06755 [Chloroflexi bacterium GWB2_49_20]|nr:MAG: hypothetical protein A2X25_06755 [Chloroflexi bacterium GWB2_49_20]OGN80262.1 MAG: hypothetical protein A2X26_08025 [Chloroflexi bacterium GWC2_49_37]OGN86098.1 MAG: hypothetical protein A2X27_00720 [Chloroflexi bacterium GWD2_49_16]HCC79403.1 hypothetical protein [Anaerolineae bacterium]HCM96376.1 hypothetical protein [Anaerolineae bacterium]